MEIGEATRKRILALCKENGITLNALSYRCGITQSTLNNIISGRNHSTTVSTVQKICEGLGIDLAAFFDDPLFYDLDQEVR